MIDALVAASWQGAVLALVVLIACRLFPRVPARFRAMLWWAVCLKMALVGFGAFTLPLAVLPARGAPDGMTALADAPPLATPAGSVPSSSGESLPTGVAAAPTFDNGTLLLVLWLAGVVVLALYLVVQALRLSALLRRSSPLPQGPLAEETRRLGVEIGVGRKPEIVLSDEVSAPMVVRPWRPTVVLPAGFARSARPEEATMALAHELAHVRRGDLWLAVVPALAQALLWFNPVAWLAAREWSTERESACDAEALLATHASPTEYGRLLMKIVAEDHRAPLTPVLGATAAYHTLKRRLNLMKTFVPRPSRALRLGGGLFATVAVLAALPWEVTAQTPKAPAETNLLTNGGFESGLDGWKKDEFRFNDRPMNATATVDRKTFHSGAAALRLSKTELSYNPVLILDQSVPVTGKTRRLKVGVWAKAQDTHKATLSVWVDKEQAWGAYVAGGNATVGVTHGWLHYEAVLDVPASAASIQLNLEMYGPGTIWMDDVSAAFVPDGTPLKEASMPKEEPVDPLAGVKDVPSTEYRAGNDPYKKYQLIGKPVGDGPSKLLVVLPGGDGGPAFNPWLRTVWREALPKGYLLAEAIAPQWSTDENRIVWPVRKLRDPRAKFTTEELVDAIVKDVSERQKIDPSKVFVMGWSSGGPAAYSTALTSSAVKGAFVAMSVYFPQNMPAPSGGRGRPFYLFQSPDDTVTTYGFALTAKKELEGAGAKVALTNYSGGHGWADDPLGNIRKGVEWLEANAK